MAILIPHFDLPFRYRFDGSPAIVEQDSEEDIANCVEALLRTREGERTFIPGFGRPGLVFQQAPLRADDIIAKIIIYEPRAEATIQQALDRFDRLVTNLEIDLAPGGP